MRACLPLLLAPLALAACTTVSGERPLSAKAQRGQAVAQARCAACHAIGPSDKAANADSPRFEAVANMPGLTEQSLRQFLRDSHNYPAAMNFSVESDQVDELAAYVITLRRADYKPEI